MQIIFDGKPDADIRATLKQNGFRWAPSQGAWQRMLNQNGIYAAKQVTEAWMPVESAEAVIEEPEGAWHIEWFICASDVMGTIPVHQAART